MTPGYEDLNEVEWDLPPKGPEPHEIPAFLWNGPIGEDGALIIGKGAA